MTEVISFPYRCSWTLNSHGIETLSCVSMIVLGLQGYVYDFEIERQSRSPYWINLPYDSEFLYVSAHAYILFCTGNNSEEANASSVLR